MLFVLKHWREIKRVRGIEKGYYLLIVTFTFLIKEIERILVNNGDMVVALIDDGATVKTFYREEGVIRLQPENDAMEPLILEDVTILGKVAAVMRFFR